MFGKETLYPVHVLPHTPLYQVSQLKPQVSKLGVQRPHFPFKPELGFKGKKETKKA